MSRVYKSIWKISEDYTNGVYKNKNTYPNRNKFRENHIFDEEQSVKWNKEEVVRRNAAINQELLAYDEETNRLMDELREDVIHTLLTDYKLNRKQAEVIYNTSYTERHSSMIDVFGYADDLAEFYDKMRQMERQ